MCVRVCVCVCVRGCGLRDKKKKKEGKEHEAGRCCLVAQAAQLPLLNFCHSSQCFLPFARVLFFLRVCACADQARVTVHDCRDCHHPFCRVLQHQRHAVCVRTCARAMRASVCLCVCLHPTDGTHTHTHSLSLSLSLSLSFSHVVQLHTVREQQPKRVRL